MESGISEDYTLTFYNLGSEPIGNEKSFIRGTHPDYIFSIFPRDKPNTPDLPVNISLPEDISKLIGINNVLYGESYKLNVGDLVLTVINYFDRQKELSELQLKYAEKAENLLKRCKLEANVNSADIFLTDLYSEYEKAFNQYAFYAAVNEYLYQVKSQHNTLVLSLIRLLVWDAQDETGVIYSNNIWDKLRELPPLLSIDLKIGLNKSGLIKYTFNSFDDIIKFDIYETINRNLVIRRCENCGKYFIPATRCSEKYCDYPISIERTCKQIGYNNKVMNDDISREYRKIYKIQNARKQRNKENIKNIDKKFAKWVFFAKDKVNECQLEKITLNDMITAINTDGWLKGD